MVEIVAATVLNERVLVFLNNGEVKIGKVVGDAIEWTGDGAVPGTVAGSGGRNPRWR